MVKEKPFNLSEKIKKVNGSIIANDFIYTKDVAEFFQRLKMTMLFTPSPKERGEFIQWLVKEIDKLAGDKFHDNM